MTPLSGLNSWLCLLLKIAVAFSRDFGQGRIGMNCVFFDLDTLKVIKIHSILLNFKVSY